MERKATGENVKIITDGGKTRLIFGEYELIGIRQIEFSQCVDEFAELKVDIFILPNGGNVRKVAKEEI